MQIGLLQAARGGFFGLVSWINHGFVPSVLLVSVVVVDETILIPECARTVPSHGKSRFAPKCHGKLGVVCNGEVPSGRKKKRPGVRYLSR